ncbi:exported hypothetical protein [Gammaproteobacteria bacterium]
MNLFSHRQTTTQFSGLLFLLFFLAISTFSIAWAAPPSQDEDEAKAFEKAFGQGPQEEDVYRTERFLSIATKHSQPLNKAPAIATVVTGQEIRDMGARNFMDVMRLVPGFGVSINEHGVNMFEVRGIRTADPSAIWRQTRILRIGERPSIVSP